MFNMKARLLTALFLTVTLLVLAGCGGSSNENEEEGAADQFTIGYAAPELSPGQQAILQGMTNYAEQKGWRVLTANADSDAGTQANQIEQFIEDRVDAIVTVPVDSQTICETIADAQEAGIPFYTIDRATIGCRINMTVLADNFLAGRQSGQALVDLLTERYGEPRGTILELQGDLRQNVGQLRGGGFHSVVDQYDNIEVISRETQWQADLVAEHAQEVLSSTEVDAIYMHSDCVMVPVVLPILEELGQRLARDNEAHVFIAGVDGCAETLQAIRDGFVDQASSQPLTDFGIIADWIEREVDGQQIMVEEVVQEGASWSPAQVQEGDFGWQLLLPTTSVTVDNVDGENLWGNLTVAE